MHNIILALITSLLLPLLTALQPKYAPPILRPSVWPPKLPSPYYWGDVLNVTKCYCESRNDGTVYPGHYYQFDYRNYHNEQVYSVAWVCDSDATTTAWVMSPSGEKRVNFEVPECWNGHDLWRKEKRKECARSAYADTFCFELGNTPEPFDYYYLNEQKRGLPDYGVEDFRPDQCVALCRDKVGGMAVASDTKGGWEKSLPSLDNHLTTLRSSFQSYTTLDDMTPNYSSPPVDVR